VNATEKLGSGYAMTSSPRRLTPFLQSFQDFGGTGDDGFFTGALISSLTLICHLSDAVSAAVDIVHLHTPLWLTLFNCKTQKELHLLVFLSVW
jgi:hypothetical protein